MHRRPLLALLDRYRKRHPEESVVVDRIRRFVGDHADCFDRGCVEGHVTGSAWVVSPDHRFTLLTHHVKLGRWLQLGGHSDGQNDSFLVALREAREESGMDLFREPSGDVPPLPLDLDVHPIPGRAGEPAHLHFDVRYLLVAAPGQTPAATDESHELRWVRADEIERFSKEESLLRMARKAEPRLRSGVVPPVAWSL